jgi:iron complex outermembrane recepter protein
MSRQVVPVPQMVTWEQHKGGTVMRLKTSSCERVQILTCTALASSWAFATGVHAQEASTDRAELQEIIVTAQKREQSAQDVPIAITAITQDALQANRVTSVQDISGMAPNMIVRPAAGGAGIPSFSMRGIVSYGVVPGSDKETSVYLDGVYISSTFGSAFELPDLERIEVLRGPQGTLFGRNATAGAISVVTRDPSGKFAVHQEVTGGNYNQFRTRTSIDLPAWGPVSASVSFVHDERRGDVQNLGAGTVWDRTGPNTGLGVLASPKYLGDKSVNTWFAAVKFEPNDTFLTTYKYDYAFNHYTPDAIAPIGINPSFPLIGPVLSAVVNSQTVPVAFDTAATRPNAVNNSFTTPAVQRNEGHNLTSDLTITDHLSLKNIASYRDSAVYSADQLDGLGGLTFTPQAVVPYATFLAFSTYPTNFNAALAAIPGYASAIAPQVGSRFLVTTDNAQTSNEQWSDELQLNYDSKLLTLTAGALYFHQQDVSGAPPGISSNFAFALIPASGRIPLGNEGTSYNKAKSLAGYTQAEVHLMPQLDLVGGFRVTRDEKSGTYVSAGTYVPGPGGFTDGTFINQVFSPFDYRKTKPTYSAGVNYKPSDFTLVYGKYSTGFVSGGAVGGVAFQPETVRSWEGGIKTDLLDHRLRSSLTIFDAKYDDLQSAQSGDNVGHPELGTVIIDQGDLTAKGVEFEGSALPLKGLTLSASFGYTNVEFGTVNPILIAATGGAYVPTLIPKWTSDLAAQYETTPLFGDARLLLRTDANWRAKERTDANPYRAAEIPVFAPIQFSPASWVVNARAALRDIKVGPTTAEVAIWARNLNNNKSTLFPLDFLSYELASDFQPARTYGVDLIVDF